MFIGRESELKFLNQYYESDQFNIFLLSGRRRIGKTRLVTEFLKDKPHIYFCASESSPKQNLKKLSRAIISFDGDYRDSGLILNSFYDALANVFELSKDHHLVFVIDEYPILSQVSPSISEILAKLIEEYKDTSQMMLILTGSSLSSVKKELLSSSNPITKEITNQLKLKPLSFKDSLRVLDKLTPLESIKVFMSFGGIPYYLEKFSPDKSLKENVITNILSANSPLFEEPENFLRREVRDLSAYNSILTNLAKGNNRVSQIAEERDEEISKTTYYLKNLIEMNLVSKETPYRENIKRSQYTIKDNFFKFYYRFIPDNISLITSGLESFIYDQIEPHFDLLIKDTFRDICLEYLQEISDKEKLPIKIKSLGRWWGINSLTNKEEKIDIIGEINSNEGLFADCDWSDDKVSSDYLKNLIQKSNLFAYPFNHYFLFSKKGFSKDCIELAQKIPNTHLITYQDIYDELKQEE